MKKSKKLQKQINILFRLYYKGNCKDRYSVDGKIKKLLNELEIEKERYLKDMDKQYYQNEATY